MHVFSIHILIFVVFNLISKIWKNKNFKIDHFRNFFIKLKKLNFIILIILINIIILLFLRWIVKITWIIWPKRMGGERDSMRTSWNLKWLQCILQVRGVPPVEGLLLFYPNSMTQLMKLRKTLRSSMWVWTRMNPNLKHFSRPCLGLPCHLVLTERSLHRNLG